jgi:hypothetical protein
MGISAISQKTIIETISASSFLLKQNRGDKNRARSCKT